jgi:spermidine/putrescine transport system permease protein
MIADIASAVQTTTRSAFRRACDWIANPWGRPRFLVLVTWAYVLVSILPVVVAIRLSFNAGRSMTTWQGFSLTQWYWGDPVNSVWHDSTLRSALIQSLKLAGLDMLIATPLGVMLAIGLTRWRSRLSTLSDFLVLLPMVTPEIVTGVAFSLVILYLFTFLHPGSAAQALGHVTFSLSYVVVIVRGRLVSIGRQYEEAAADLGATPWESLRFVLLPLLAPAILSSLMIVFAISIDDFVISQWLSCGAGCDTVPIRIYGAARASPLPSVNALAALMVYFTVLALGLAYVLFRLLTRGERAPSAPGRRAAATVGGLDF